MDHLGGFVSNGRVYKGGGESAKAGEWSYRTSGHGKDGLMSIKHKEAEREIANSR